MTPPKEYFTRCKPGQGQQVGAEWFRFINKDSLSMALNDGVIDGDSNERERIEELQDEVRSLENCNADLRSSLESKNEEIERLEEQVAELEQQLAEAQKK